MSCNGVEAIRTEDFVRSYIDLTGRLDFTNYTASFRIAAKEGDPPLLSVSQSATPNGSSTLCQGQSITVGIRPDDLQTLPLASPVSDPWVGWFEADITNLSGIVTSLDRGSFVLHRGI